ncbi:unnamed protein product [Mytilus edulis]|uniref:Uncharacterized protein n=1 Tax=Mytilus edulis TaxID=6550 RepID=A0A8S3T269_MYTED|nr:unnamed protein product [Mytilus edulis]
MMWTKLKQNTTRTWSTCRNTLQSSLPKAIHVTDNSILVSTREKGEPWPLTEHSRRQIVVLDQSGKQKINVIEYDRQNKRLFSLIYRMKMDKMGNIIAIDAPSNDVVILVKVVKNAIAWIYEGNSDIYTDEVAFYSSGLSVTKVGNIVVTDEDTSSLHILSGDGILIKCCMMKNLNILLPHCLHIDFYGNLWIGCYKDTDSKENSNIYNLEISGC